MGIDMFSNQYSFWNLSFNLLILTQFILVMANPPSVEDLDYGVETRQRFERGTSHYRKLTIHSSCSRIIARSCLPGGPDRIRTREHLLSHLHTCTCWFSRSNICLDLFLRCAGQENLDEQGAGVCSFVARSSNLLIFPPTYLSLAKNMHSLCRSKDDDSEDVDVFSKVSLRPVQAQIQFVSACNSQNTPIKF